MCPTGLAGLQRDIEHAAHLLPTQGPITVFIHHNTLHAFEDLPFDEAVVEAQTSSWREPYLSEARYRRELESGEFCRTTCTRSCSTIWPIKVTC